MIPVERDLFGCRQLGVVQLALVAVEGGEGVHTLFEDLLVLLLYVAIPEAVFQRQPVTVTVVRSLKVLQVAHFLIQGDVILLQLLALVPKVRDLCVDFLLLSFQVPQPVVITVCMYLLITFSSVTFQVQSVCS